MENNKANYFVCSFVWYTAPFLKESIDQRVQIGSSVALGIPCPDHQLLLQHCIFALTENESYPVLKEGPWLLDCASFAGLSPAHFWKQPSDVFIYPYSWNNLGLQQKELEITKLFTGETYIESSSHLWPFSFSHLGPKGYSQQNNFRPLRSPLSVSVTGRLTVNCK